MPLVDNAWYTNGSTGVQVFDLGSQQTSAGATVTITGVTVPAGALIVVVAAEVTSAAAGTCADGTNGAYTVATSGAMSTAAGFGTLFYFPNSAALTNATITFTKQTTARAASIAAFYVTGILAASPLDAAVTATTAVNSATPTVTSGTPAQAGELIIGACAYSNASARTLTNTGSFNTPFANQTGQPTASVGGGHLNVNGSGVVTFTPTLAAASDNRTMIVGFKLITTTLVGWWNVTRWAASTTKVTGNMVRQNATPNLNAERVFVCIASTAGTGTTAASEPAWSTTAAATRGAKFTDNTVTWMEATGVAALNGDLTNTPNWNTVKNTAIVQGQVIQNVAGTLILICTTAGTAGNAAEPSWAAFTNAGATTADNTVTWTTLGASFSAWAAPHARMANAVTTNWGAVNDFFFVGDNHAEFQTSNLTISVPAAGQVLCVDHTVAPPTSANLKTTATISMSGNATTLSFSNGPFYCYGIIFVAGGTLGSINLTLGGNSNVAKFQFCSFRLMSSNSNLTAGNGNGFMFWDNCTVQFGVTSLSLLPNAKLFKWTNTLSAILGTPPTNLFAAGNTFGGLIVLDGIDLSAMGSNVIAAANNTAGLGLFNRCKLGASSGLAQTPTVEGRLIDFIQCDSGATNYTQSRIAYPGRQDVETTIVRTGGASDGTTPISWKIATNANSTWGIRAYESIPLVIWNDVTGAHTVTIFGTTTGGGVPNNDDIWVEVEYLGDASTPQASVATSTKANILVASTTTNNSSDGSTWGGAGAGNGFKMVVPSFTVNQKGYISVLVRVAKVSSTYYVDPKILLS
jgi:hypothetical protein